MGHSGLTGEGTAGQSEPNVAASWATGTRPAVQSVYLRLVDIRPATEGKVANTAAGGAPASLLVDQTKAALRVVPAPLLAIIQTVDNDIACDGSNVEAVGQSLAEALEVIRAASPNTQILVVGQAGRPSVAFIEQLVAYDPSTKAGMTWDDDCSFFDGEGNLRKDGVAKLSAVIDKYEAETARVCAAVPNCSTDGGVRKAYVDKIDNFASDYAHFNEKGQAAMAELIWPTVEHLVGQ
jgi:lysophospholipase L1-like esterase